MDVEELRAKLNEKLRELGLSDEHIREIEKGARAIKAAREKALEELRQEKGEDVFFVAEIMQRLYAMVTSTAQITALVNEERRPRAEAAYTTAVKMATDVLGLLQQKFKLSDSDMEDLTGFSEAVMKQVLDQSAEQIARLEAREEAA